MQLTNPSHATDAPISFFFTPRPRAPEHRADVSPIVSVAETKKMHITARMASRLNSGVNGMNVGRATMGMSVTLLKSIIPMHRARR